MPYLSDRQRVEILLPAQLMLGVILAGVTEKNDPDFLACKAHLLEAAKDTTADLPPRTRSKILSRVRRLHQEVATPYTRDGGSAGAFGLILFYWLEHLVEVGYFAFTEGSAIDQALAIFVPAIEHHTRTEALDTVAREQADRFLRELQSRGYFESVPISAPLGCPNGR